MKLSRLSCCFRLLKAVCLLAVAWSFPLVVVADGDKLQISAGRFNNLGVEVGRLTPVTQVPLLSAPATVTVPPAHERVISAAQAGIITQLHAAIGDAVKKGQILAQINSPDLLTLQSNYLKAASDLALATSAYRRDKKLLQEGVVASRRAQEALTHQNVAALALNEAKQLLVIAGMSVDEIDLLARTHRLVGEFPIRAPISGVILERLAVVGTRVDILAPLYRMANLRELWLDIALPQEKIRLVKLGDSVSVEDTPVQGEISLLGQNVNPENQTLSARAVITGGLAEVRVGQRVNIQLIQTFPTAAFKVPNTAIAQNEGKAFIFKRTPEGFIVSPVAVVGRLSTEAVIQGNFNGTEEIAIKGVVALKANWLGLGSDE